MRGPGERWSASGTISAKFGVDAFGQTAMRDYFTAYSQGWQAEVTPAVKQLTGTAARSVGEFARDFAVAFGKR